MTNLKNAEPTQYQINVGNVEVTVQLNEWVNKNSNLFKGYAEKAKKHCGCICENSYTIEYVYKFGKSKHIESYTVLSKNMDSIIEYLRNVYRGVKCSENKLAWVIPYSWE